jgi:pimeloyl-[acyl-carrier protein] methyl ester esterase
VPSKTGNQPEIEIIAYHGWGFNSSFWNKWHDIVPDSVVLKTADRGYYLEEKRPCFSDDSTQKVVFLHSFGLHWCPKENIEEANCIVIFNGFKEFHSGEGVDTKKSKLILKKMISEFDKNPDKVLKKFLENAFHPEEPSKVPAKSFDKELMLSDLKNLDTSAFKLKHLKNGKPIISLDGGKDHILFQTRGKGFTDFTEGNAVYHFIKEAGHCLPVTHTQDCWSFINAMIPIFQNNGNYRRKRPQ